LLAGTLSREKVNSFRDRQANRLMNCAKTAGCDMSDLSSVKLAKNSYAAFVELHIEQGPLLEKENIPIGVVEKIAAPSTLRVQLIGVGGHAGAVLMPERHDAGLAGAEISLAVENAAKASGSADTVGTTGVFRIEPGAVNSVPCRAWLEIDLRDTLVKTRDAALEQIEKSLARFAKRRGVELQTERLNLDAPAICDAKLVETVVGVCKELNLPVQKMISRAYHDFAFHGEDLPNDDDFHSVPQRLQPSPR